MAIMQARIEPLLAAAGLVATAEDDGCSLWIEREAEPPDTQTSYSRVVHQLVGLIRFRGHLPKGGYDVPNAQEQQKPAATPAVH
jgi:hypothetical protein